MDHWTEPQLMTFLQEKRPEHIFHLAKGLIEHLKFEFISFTFLPADIECHADAIQLHNYPSEWAAYYRDHDCLGFDPVVRHCRRTLAPVQWSDELFCEHPQFWRRAQHHGLRHGMSQASCDGFGNIGILSVARREWAITDHEHYQLSMPLFWLALTLHTRLGGRLLRGDKPTLSERELQVLRMSADGNTAKQIAKHLYLSERTVNFHITSAIHKLKAQNKTQAVVQAVRFGLV